MNFYYPNIIWVCLAFILYYIEIRFISTESLNSGHRTVAHDRRQINTVKKKFCPLNSTKCERVKGGIEAKRGQFPFFVALQRRWRDPQLICGGSILNRYYILTAAHCLYKKPNEKYTHLDVQVKAGFLSFKETVPEYLDVQTRDVFRLIVHPEYWYRSDPFRSYNDIGLILLSSFLKFKPNAVMPISLPNRHQRISGKVTLPGLAGYGRRPVLNQLNYIQMRLVSKEECLRNLTRGMFPSGMLNNVICALTTAEQSACFGDSGGPLTYYGNKPYVVGVQSWIPYESCNYNISYVLVHTDVRKYLNFINSHIHTLPWGGNVYSERWASARC